MLRSFRQRSFTVASLMGAILTLSACSAGQPLPPPLPELEKAAPYTLADATFSQTLNELDLTQTALATLATSHAGRSDLAVLGATIAKDLTENQKALAKLAAAHSVTLTTAPSAANQKIIDRMQRLRGASFDRSYVRQFTLAHTHIKPSLESQISTSKNKDLVKLATDAQTKLNSYDAQMH
ncbi:DUF4142 domain-containing protein [Acetobacter indonesiensis]|uniref:DUF4142 domain-containing protein n=1 Tax=Acetobacter indonesiensis TaxID=104101 RepID=UPI0020A35600|nr:DUF4142 domain-containing protein [Acetobacter indonesiensis]MCP1230000.1 DUF4142 domain-containing protein [Acetobacter indonesiensis]